MLLLNKSLPEDIDEIKRSLLCVRFGSGHIVPFTLWKEQTIRGEHIPSKSIFTQCIITLSETGVKL